MKNLFQLMSIAMLCLTLAACATQKHMDFGEPMPEVSTKPIALETVLADVERFNGQFLQIQGKVAEVCVPKGCWITLSPVDSAKEGELWIKFVCNFEGRLIPMDAVGYEAIVAGTLIVKTVSEENRRHLAGDAGKSAEEIAAIVGNVKQVHISAPSARIIGLDAKKIAAQKATSQPAE